MMTMLRVSYDSFQGGQANSGTHTRQQESRVLQWSTKALAAVPSQEAVGGTRAESLQSR